MFWPSMFIAQEPPILSRQKRRKVSVESTSFLILIQKAQNCTHPANSLIKTGICWGTACHDRVDEANARFLRERGILLYVRRARVIPEGASIVVSRSQTNEIRSLFLFVLDDDLLICSLTSLHSGLTALQGF